MTQEGHNPASNVIYVDFVLKRRIYSHHCPLCGLPVLPGQSIIDVDDERYHENCVTSPATALDLY